MATIPHSWLWQWPWGQWSAFLVSASCQRSTMDFYLKGWSWIWSCHFQRGHCRHLVLFYLLQTGATCLAKAFVYIKRISRHNMQSCLLGKGWRVGKAVDRQKDLRERRLKGRFGEELSSFCNLTFYFMLEYSQLTVLWWLQVHSRVTQPYTYTYPFCCRLSPSKLPYSIEQSLLCYMVGPF